MRNKLLLIICLLLFAGLHSLAQKQVNSPYSRFNFGTLEPVGAFRSQAMGGASVALRDNLSIFFSNPASYAAFDTTSFLFDFGIDYSINRLKSGSESHKSDDMNFDHMILGFPLSRRIGIAAGIVPVSNGYYRLRNDVVSTDPEYDPLIGGYTSSHNGDGGFSQLFTGAGVELHKFLSAGVNMTILFGEINRTNKFVFEDSENFYHNNSNEKLQLNGINFDYGLQFTYPLKDNTFFNAGLTYTAAKKYNSDYENFVFRYNSFGSADTISFTSGESSPVKLPGTIKTGIAYGKLNKFTVAFDYITTAWSKSSIPGSEGYAADTKTFILGIEYTPERFSNFSFLRRMDYRIGGRFGDNYLLINGEQVKEMSITAGFGIPLRRGNYSKANFFVDLTRRYGSETNGMHNESFITAGASLNLYDWWFRKRKYD